MTRKTHIVVEKSERKSGNWFHKGRYRKWLALHQVLAGSVTQLFIYAWNQCTTKLSMLFQVLGLWLLVESTLEKNILFRFRSNCN